MNKTYTYAFILGSHPELSLAEIKAVVRPKDINTDGKYVGVVELENSIDVAAVMGRLGGTVKIAELTQEFEKPTKVDLAQLSKLVPANGGRAVFGVTAYQVDQVFTSKQLPSWSKGLGLHLKEWFKEGGRGARLVTNQDGTPLSAVTIDREKLLTKGREIVFVLVDGMVRAGVTVAVQPYEAFGARDFARPGRSMKTGMLPPKIARILVNLAQPQLESRMLDPFVGTGTILQEALLLGYKKVEGNDLDPKALDYTRKNLAWLHLPQVKIHNYKAEKLPFHIKSGVYDRIIFEGYLGPTDEWAIRKKLDDIQTELQELYGASLISFRQLLKPGGRIVGAFPAWRLQAGQEPITLPIKLLATQAGLEVVDGPFYYGRPDAVVLREIWVLRSPEKSI